MGERSATDKTTSTISSETISEIASENGLRVMIAGGGTGGHLFPGIALAQEVVARGGEVVFVGTKRGLEAKVLPEQGWELKLLDVSALKGGGVGGVLRGLGRLPKAWLQSRKLIKGTNPDVVVGVGGYASGPLVATAAMMGIPSAIMEQNQVPGITNRYLSKLVKRVCTTFSDSPGHFPKKKVVVTGNPVRSELIDELGESAKAGPRERDAGSLRIFVFGGSHGAKVLNDALLESFEKLGEAFGQLEIWHQSGKRDFERVQGEYERLGIDTDKTVKHTAFIDKMADPYCWCDLVVCRAGATSLAELAVVGKPAILIPYPYAADDHQVANAQALVEVGAAQMLVEKELTPQRFVEQIVHMAGNPSTLRSMSAAMAKAARPDAASAIYAELERLAPKRR